MAPPDGAADADKDEEWRKMTLAEGVSITGSTGLLGTAYAGPSVRNMLRVAFWLDWFTTSGLL